MSILFFEFFNFIVIGDSLLFSKCRSFTAFVYNLSFFAKSRLFDITFNMKSIVLRWLTLIFFFLACDINIIIRYSFFSVLRFHTEVCRFVKTSKVLLCFCSFDGSDVVLKFIESDIFVHVMFDRTIGVLLIEIRACTFKPFLFLIPLTLISIGPLEQLIIMRINNFPYIARLNLTFFHNRIKIKNIETLRFIRI